MQKQKSWSRLPPLSGSFFDIKPWFFFQNKPQKRIEILSFACLIISTAWRWPHLTKIDTLKSRNTMLNEIFTQKYSSLTCSWAKYSGFWCSWAKFSRFWCSCSLLISLNSMNKWACSFAHDFKFFFMRIHVYRMIRKVKFEVFCTPKQVCLK